MGFLIVFLFSKVHLDLAHVQQLSGALELCRQLLLEVETVLLKSLGVSILKFHYFILILFLGFLQLEVPMFVKVLVLLDMGVLDLLLPLVVLEEHLLVVHVELLLLEFGNSVLSHLSL